MHIFNFHLIQVINSSVNLFSNNIKQYSSILLKAKKIYFFRGYLILKILLHDSSIMRNFYLRVIEKRLAFKNGRILEY